MSHPAAPTTYTTRPHGATTLIIDATTGDPLAVCGSAREATTIIKTLHAHQAHRADKAQPTTRQGAAHRARLHALTTKTFAILNPNKGTHPAALAARQHRHA